MNIDATCVAASLMEEFEYHFKKFKEGEDDLLLGTFLFNIQVQLAYWIEVAHENGLCQDKITECAIQHGIEEAKFYRKLK